MACGTRCDRTGKADTHCGLGAGRWWLLPSTTRAGEEEQAGGGGGGSAETVCQRPLTWVRAVTLFPMSGSMGGSSPT